MAVLEEWDDYVAILKELEPYQAKMAALNNKAKAQLAKGGQSNTSPYIKSVPLSRSKSAPPGFGAVGEGAADEDIVSSFVLKQTLEPNLYNKDKKLKENIKDRLIKIAEDFYDKLDLDLPLVDIIITGSIANYNWSKYSDIDLHLLLDFRDVNQDTELVKSFFGEAKTNWNRTHEILIDGYEVEVYLQDINEEHHSSGVYSLLKDEWMIEPVREEFAIEDSQVNKKAESFIKEIDAVESTLNNEKPEEAYGDADRLKEKIMKYRKSGLERGGAFSVENLVFKYLRRSEDMGRLLDFKRQAYDSIMSMGEE